MPRKKSKNNISENPFSYHSLLISKPGQYLKYCDIFGPSFSLKVNNQDTYKSGVGAILTIIWIVLVILGVAHLMYELLDTTSPSSTISKEHADSNLELDLYKNNIYPGFAVLSNNGTGILLKNNTEFFSFFTHKARMVYLKSATTFQDKDKFFEDAIYLNHHHIDCSDINDTRITDQAAEDKVSTNFFENINICSDTDDTNSLKIKGSPSTEDYRYLEFLFYPCSLEPSKCAPI